MSTTTKNCEECSNHRAVLGNELACALDHKPRWFSPKGTLDQNYGWKRKCDDFRPMGHNGEVRGASRLAGEASSAEGATSTVVLGADRLGKD